MDHSPHLEKKSSLVRLRQGTDVCMVPTAQPDIVVCRIAFSGGDVRDGAAGTLARMVSHLMPTGTRGVSRRQVRNALEHTGARVSITEGVMHLYVTIESRSCALYDVLNVLMPVLRAPAVSEREFEESRTALDALLHHLEEDTDALAHGALMRALYARGHPHFVEPIRIIRKKLAQITRREVLAFHGRTLSSVGGLVCLGGDVQKIAHLDRVMELLDSVPMLPDAKDGPVQLAMCKRGETDTTVVSVPGKMNIDTEVGIPLAVTREHSDFHALQLGVSVLGGSNTSRLFHELRTVRSLTYGSYASLAGFGDGFPGYVRATAMFPNDVFLAGRDTLQQVIRHWIERGITKQELVARQTESVGNFIVSLASTSGLVRAAFSALHAGRPLSYVDTYPERVRALSLREVNTAIREHMSIDRMHLTAAGSIDSNGNVL